MARPRHPLLETLEDRCVPATWGNPWPDAQHLTISFAPDGTAIGGQNSTLFSTFQNQPNWQREMLRAFQTWLSEAGVTVGVVDDGGQAFGVAGRPQSDPRFGDIRIGAGNYSSTELVFSAPFDLAAGTSSGDVRVNAPMWKSGNYDLYTVMLQEVGHVLGVGNSNDRSSVMFEEYLGKRNGLSAGDIASVRALYGARPDDAFEGSGNATLATATRLSLLGNSTGLLSIGVDGDLTRRGDVDFYRFSAPSVTGGLQITLARDGYSLLTPRVTVYDSLGRVVGSAVSTDPQGGNLSIKLNNVTPLGTYYVKVEAATTASFDIGAYHLNIQSLPILNPLVQGVTGLADGVGEVLVRNDLHTNDSFLTAQNLLSGVFAPDSKFDIAHQASISDPRDEDYYRIQAPTATAGDSVLQIMAWGTGRSQLQPRVTVYDANRQVVPMQILVNEGGVLTLQLVGYKAGATYFVKLEGADRGPGATGNYFLGVDFGTTATQLATLADSQLSATTPSQQGKLTITKSNLFHFVLSADANTGTGVEMTIVDRNGAIIGRLLANAGETTSLTLTMPTGEYLVRFTTFRKDGKPITPVRFTLRGTMLTDPAGPQAEDPTMNPSTPPADNSGGGAGTTTTTSPGGTTNQPANPYGGWYQWNWYGQQTTSRGTEDAWGAGYTA